MCDAMPHGGKEMPDPEVAEARELLIGTWIGVALIADTLVEHGILSREELLLILSQTEEAASDKRRTALAGLRLLISRGFRCTPPSKAGVIRQRSGHPSGCRRLRRPGNRRLYQSYTICNLREFIDIGVGRTHRKE